MKKIILFLSVLGLWQSAFAGNSKNFNQVCFDNGDCISSTRTLASIPVSSFTTSGVTAGSYTNTNITVDAQGRITTASSGSAGNGSTVYDATSTAGFPFGFSASTGVFTSSVNAQSLILTYGVRAATAVYTGQVTANGGYSSGSGNYSTTSGFLTSGSGSNGTSVGPTQVTLSRSSTGGNPLTIADNTNRSILVPIYSAISFSYFPTDEGSNFSGGAFYGQLNSTATTIPKKAYAVVGAGNSTTNLNNTATTYFRIDVSTVNTGDVGTVEVLTGALAQRVGGAFFTMTVSSTASNSTGEINLVANGTGTITIPANFMQVGRSIKIKATGYYSSTSAAGNFSLKYKFGSTVMASTVTFALVDSQANQLFMYGITLTVRSTGASGTLIGNGALGMYDTTNGFRIFPTLNTAAVTVDTTASQTVSLTAQFSKADTLNSVTLTNMVLSTE